MGNWGEVLMGWLRGCLVCVWLGCQLVVCCGGALHRLLLLWGWERGLGWPSYGIFCCGVGLVQGLLAWTWGGGVGFGWCSLASWGRGLTFGRPVLVIVEVWLCVQQVWVDVVAWLRFPMVG